MTQADFQKIQSQVNNQHEHIKWLLASVKELQHDRESDRAELKRLRKRMEREDSE